jgi:hypothetical protein
MIYLTLSRGEDRLETVHLTEHASPHSWENVDFYLLEHPLIEKAQQGDLITIHYKVGGGGGHELFVEQFKIALISRLEIAPLK